jgi:hypothetical protein
MKMRLLFTAISVVALLAALAGTSTASPSTAARLAAPTASPRYCPALPKTYNKKRQVPVWANMEIRNAKGEIVPEVAFSIRNFKPRSQNFSYAGDGVWSGCWSVSFYRVGHAPTRLCISLHLGVTMQDGGSACRPVTTGPSGLEVRYALTTAPAAVTGFQPATVNPATAATTPAPPSP